MKGISSVSLLVLFFIYARSINLVGTVVANVEEETINLAQIDVSSGTVTLIANLTHLGGGLSGHVLRYGQKKQNIFLVTINIENTDNNLYSMDLQGNINNNFTVKTVMGTLEWCENSKTLITVSVDPTTHNQDVATIRYEHLLCSHSQQLFS